MPNSTKNICLVSHTLPPSPSGQAIMLYRLLKGLPKTDYSITLVSSNPSDDNGKQYIATEQLPAKHYQIKLSKRIPVIRTPVLTFGITLINILFQIYSNAIQVKKIAEKEQCQLLLACSGDICDLPSTLLASKWLNVPFVAYLFDDYANQWIGFTRLISKKLEPIIMRHAKGVIVPNEFMYEEYLRRYGTRSSVIYNPCLLPDLSELDGTERVLDERDINIVYTGAIYHAHYDAFRRLIQAIQIIGRKDLKLHLYTAAAEDELKLNGIWGPMIVLHPHVKESEVCKITRQADILFLPLAFDSPIQEVIRTSAPGKTGEYLSVGRPVLLHAPPGSFVNWFFKEHKCGVVVEKDCPTALAVAVTRIITDIEFQETLSETARKVAEARFNVEKMQTQFFTFLKSC